MITAVLKLSMILQELRGTLLFCTKSKKINCLRGRMLGTERIKIASIRCGIAGEGEDGKRRN